MSLPAPSLPGPATVPQMARLLEINLALNATLDLDALLALILRSACEVIGCEEASILLYDAEAGHLIFAAASGPAAAQLVSMPVPLDDSLAGTIFRENRPVITGDASADARHYSGVDAALDFQTRSLLGVPMRIDGTPTGVLEAINKRSGGFTGADTELLNILAAQAAVAIRNARQTAALRAAYAAVERANRLKTNVVTLASHELRTPLAAVIGYSDLLRDLVTDDARDLLAEVSEAAQKMNGIIEALTDLMNVLGEDARQDRVPFARHVAEAVDEVRASGRTVAHTFPARETDVAGHPGHLRAAVRHILANAAQFSDPGSPIEAHLLEDRDVLMLEVTDRGVGIDPAHHALVFEPFFQVEDALTRRHSGLGIGLTYVREVASSHGGTVELESPGLGHGTTFRLRLPSLSVASPRPAARQAVQVPAP